MPTPTISFEIELTLSGTVIPYQAATGPTHDSGGQPAEGGCAEDVEIDDIGILFSVPGKPRFAPHYGYETKSILDGIDKKDPAIQKLFANILAMKGDDASEAVYDASFE
jgi:hypothetical protein